MILYLKQVFSRILSILGMKGFVLKHVMLSQYKKRHILLGDGVNISSSSLQEYVNVAHHAEIVNANIGKRTSVGRYTKIRDCDIGKYCSISWDVTIGAVSHPMYAISMHAFSFREQFGLIKFDYNIPHQRVVIGHDVWIGCNAVIMEGVRIGDGAVIGAAAVVTKDVAPYEIVVGVPAKHLGFRFNKEVIGKLEQIKWWDFPDDVLKRKIELFNYKNDLRKNISLLDGLMNK